MPAATSSGHVSIEEYRRTSYEPDAEYVDGRIEERPMGEYDAAGPPIFWTPLPLVAAAARLRRPATEARSAQGLSKLPRHAAWQEALLLWFRQHAGEWRIRVKPELRVQVSATRFRVPDITVLGRERPIEPVIKRAGR